MATQKTETGPGAAPAREHRRASADSTVEDDALHSNGFSEPLLNGHRENEGDLEAQGGHATDGDSRPLLEAPDEATWTPPPGFLLMEIAIMTNVFLYGFDGTITASTYAVISSEFDAANKASWLTTSYLITSAAFQPLYGRVSDIFGRRRCFFFSSIGFAVGCLGCGLAPNILILNCMRALAGVGGAGLMTMGMFLNASAGVATNTRP